jgi:hypothetical protein
VNSPSIPVDDMCFFLKPDCQKVGQFDEKGVKFDLKKVKKNYLKKYYWQLQVLAFTNLTLSQLRNAIDLFASFIGKYHLKQVWKHKLFVCVLFFLELNILLLLINFIHKNLC